jgi:diguanylate cyclase (GGDEF)-like protein
MASFYGVAALLTPLHAPPLLDSLLLLMLSTVVSTATLAYAVIPTQYLWTAAVCFTPLLGRFAYRGLAQQDQTFGALALLAVIWLVVVLNKSRLASRTAHEALVLNRRLQDEIEEHERTREALRQLALVDPLTGLGNRRHFDATLHRTLSQAERDGSRFGVLAIDLDDFKLLNDRFGHPMGDALLQAVAQRLQAAVRAGDFCARVGGDEFAVIVLGVHSASDLQGVSQKLRAELKQANPFNAAAPPNRASVGWAVYPDDGGNAIDLMALADARMYLDKNAHKLPQITRTPVR